MSKPLLEQAPVPPTEPLLQLHPDAAFRKTLEFSGRFIVDEVPTKPFHVRIELPEDRPGAIYGRVYGKSDEHTELLSVLGNRNCRLESIAPDGAASSAEQVFSSSFIVRRLSSGRQSNVMDLSYVHQCLAEIAFLDLQQVLPLRHGDAHRSVSFAVTGPEYYWGLYGLRRFDPDGTVSFFQRKPHKTVFLDRAVGVTCHAAKSYLYSHQNRREVFVSAPLISLSLEWYPKADHVPDAEILSLSKEYADDIPAAMSFISRREITWFKYWFTSRDSLVEYTRDLGISAGDGRSLDPYEQQGGPVEIVSVYQFLRHVRKNCQELRREEYDLRQIIALYVAGTTSRYVEEQFIALFRALEKFIAEYRSDQSDDGFIPRERWRSLCPDLERYVRTLLKKETENKRTSIARGVAGLNRRPIKTVFQEMMQKYKIPWHDVADSTSPLGFIDLRNDVMHRSNEKSLSRFVEEIARLRVVVGRLILWRLGWHKYEQAGWEYRRRSLRRIS